MDQSSLGHGASFLKEITLNGMFKDNQKELRGWEEGEERKGQKNINIYIYVNTHILKYKIYN